MINRMNVSKYFRSLALLRLSLTVKPAAENASLGPNVIAYILLSSRESTAASPIVHINGMVASGYSTFRRKTQQRGVWPRPLPLLSILSDTSRQYCTNPNYIMIIILNRLAHGAFGIRSQYICKAYQIDRSSDDDYEMVPSGQYDLKRNK